MVAITVNQKVFERLKQAYVEKFGGSPMLLITALNNIYHTQANNLKDVISDKTIRNFFKNTEPMKMQEKNLNFLCGVLLECESYQEALRQQAALEQVELTNTNENGDWLDLYQEYIRTKCGTMKVLTMTQPVELDSIYAKVNVLKSIKAKKQKTIEELLAHISSGRMNDRVSDKNISALNAVKSYQKLIIWGNPGAGKTTFLKYLSMHSATELGKQLIPIFISLKAWADEEDKPDLIDVVTREFVRCIPEPDQLVQELLLQGRCLILLDGLDEVVEAERNRIFRSVNTFVEQFSKNRFVLTCRSGASDYTFEYFTEVEMVHFDENQVTMFVQKWFASSQEPNLREKFLEELERNSSIKELTTSPLLLTMLCLVFEDNYDFPKNRYLLFDEAVNILLRKWDASRRIDRSLINKFNLPYLRKIHLISKLAYEAFNQEPAKYFWYQWELEDLIQNYIKNIPEIAHETLADESLSVLKTIEANHGLLAQQAKDVYSFSHQSFREYFVANYVVENYKVLNEVLKQHLTKRQWQEVFIMIAGRLANADEFLKIMFCQVNMLVKSQRMQDMLNWLYEVTVYHSVKSSSWRAFYLFIDQWFELYTNRLTKSHSPLAEKLAYILREVNIERGKIIERPRFSNFALNLVDFHAQVFAKASGKEFEPQKVNALLRKELPVNDEPTISSQLQNVVTIDQEKGVITINKQKSQVTLDKEHYRTDINEKDINATAQQPNYDDLREELTTLKESMPSDNDPRFDWQQWADQLSAFMKLYLHISYNYLKFSQEEIQTLEDYFYANILLIECIRGGSYSSQNLRDQLIDHLLLPSKLIPPELLPSTYKDNELPLTKN